MSILTTILSVATSEVLEHWLLTYSTVYMSNTDVENLLSTNKNK